MWEMVLCQLRCALGHLGMDLAAKEDHWIP